MDRVRHPSRPQEQVRRPGDRVVRRAVAPREAVRLPKPRQPRRPRPIAFRLVLGFAGLILTGTLLLSLPFAAADGQRAGVIDALFTATSAVCVTGLVVRDTATNWSGFGQAVILLLIQLGGFGFATSATLLLALLGVRPTLRDRLACGMSLGEAGPGGVVRLLRRLAGLTLAIEVAGAIALLPAALAATGSLGSGLWWAVFHSVSAFNNAGFDVVGGFRSLTPYQREPLVLVPVAILVILGGLSFAVISDVVRERRWGRLTLDSKLVLVTTASLLITGTLLFLAFEWSNPRTLGPLPWPDKVLNAFFHAVVPRTAGFNSLDVAHLNDESLFVTIGLMFVGGASGSFAGGIKVQSFAVLLLAVWAVLRGRPHVAAFGREVASEFVFRAMAIALLAVALVFLASFVISLIEPFGLLAIWFETTSAFGTVGLSTGITPQLHDASKVVLVATMFAGRLGPLTLALALAERARPEPIRYARTAIALG
ncbi:TrkH family potassium uptake protein [Thermomicrobium roseum]|uniref:V-type sodium ATP synthase subunit J (Na(+)-translocating ATPase subunit J) n=1 Tax=Thermomicrobium roseum (strain ATCC 27502 / DSM 5159 / P-2) TaxID=309801 RepID=B9L3I1_THERP|nr:Trk family potassium uptake protein [Thermomicrobium roseum]ACM06852.1 V-type sodium ATP synthase subunit J (Na(+)-translocating ATPase subunit J) [Thermomicrobium roseum DSM 5159]